MKLKQQLKLILETSWAKIVQKKCLVGERVLYSEYLFAFSNELSGDSGSGLVALRLAP